MEKEDTMKLDKILTLLEAGFTKDEILSMEKENEPQEAQKEPEIKKDEISKDEPKKDEVLKDEGFEIREDYLKTMKEMTDEFKKIRDDLKKSALSGYDQQISDPISEGQKVLAKIIDPPARAKKKG